MATKLFEPGTMRQRVASTKGSDGLQERIYAARQMVEVSRALGTGRAADLMSSLFPGCMRFDSFISRSKVLVAISLLCSRTRTGVCDVETSVLAAMTGLSCSSVRFHVSRLLEGGLVERGRTYRLDGAQRNAIRVGCYRMTRAGSAVAECFRGVLPEREMGADARRAMESTLERACASVRAR